MIMRRVHKFGAIFSNDPEDTTPPIVSLPNGYIPLREGTSIAWQGTEVKMRVLAIYVGKKKAKSVAMFPLTWQGIRAHPGCPPLGLALPLPVVHELLGAVR